MSLPGPIEDRERRDTPRVVLFGLFVNLGLAAGKLAGGLLGRSEALIADAAESTSDILASVVIWGGLAVGARPPDENHPYGHGKAEALAALTVAVLIAAAGTGIGLHALRELFGAGERPAPWTLLVLVGVLVVKELMFQLLHRAGRETGRNALVVEAWHHRSDAITSGAALVGVALAVFGGPGLWRADDVAALIASGIIVFNGLRLARLPLKELMDEQPRELPGKVDRIARNVDGVEDVEKTLARKLGARYWVDMHVEVDPHISVHDGHEIARTVRTAIQEEIPAVQEVLVHIEPHAPRAGAVEAETRSEEDPAHGRSGSRAPTRENR
jgi:cation diffusion facilitator family transporter